MRGTGEPPYITRLERKRCGVSQRREFDREKCLKPEPDTLLCPGEFRKLIPAMYSLRVVIGRKRELRRGFWDCAAASCLVVLLYYGMNGDVESCAVVVFHLTSFFRGSGKSIKP